MTGPGLLFAVLDARLTPRQREAFLDRLVLGHTTDQVAADMGITRSGVSQLLDRARERLARKGGYLATLRDAA